MIKTAQRFMYRVCRTLLLLTLATLGTVALMRLAPGYYANVNEMDTQYGQSAKAEIETERKQDGSVVRSTATLLNRLVHADAGKSRQYGVPVADLVWPRLSVTGGLLLRGVVSG